MPNATTVHPIGNIRDDKRPHGGPHGGTHGGTHGATTGSTGSLVGFTLSGTTCIGALADAYGVKIDANDRGRTIGDYLARSACGYPLPGDQVRLGGLQLTVLSRVGRSVEKVGLAFRPGLAAPRNEGAAEVRT